MRNNNRLTALFTLALLFLFITAAGAKKEAEIIFEAERENEPIPLPTTGNPGLTLEGTYEIQTEYVRLKLGNDKIAGYKAGLTSRGAQEKFGVSTPVSGVLFSSGMYMNSPSVDGSKLRGPVIETEIGFVVGKPIEEKITDAGRLMDHISTIMPVIEIPEAGFADMNKLKAEDIVAANVGSAAFITGAQKPLANDDLDGLIVELVSGGETLYEGRGSDAMGGQREALLWLVNSVLGNGWKIEKGNILITGALGNVVPANPGRYEARYGGLGNISFEIKR
ncbi:MAG TPA: fumarylacetoacetate hydrolase family protein [Thermodesulfobacteriota bacterium]|nr:fumarylacetoacetate hydrolase family protein [Thermodesulfobacteriota bacterium]